MNPIVMYNHNVLIKMGKGKENSSSANNCVYMILQAGTSDRKPNGGELISVKRSEVWEEEICTEAYVCRNQLRGGKGGRGVYGDVQVLMSFKYWMNEGATVNPQTTKEK